MLPIIASVLCRSKASKDPSGSFTRANHLVDLLQIEMRIEDVH